MQLPNLRQGFLRMGRARSCFQHVGASAALNLDVPGARASACNRVSVYPSDFGLERMAEEARVGPRALFGNGSSRAAAAAPGASAGGGPGGAAASPGSDDESPATSGERLWLPCNHAAVLCINGI